MTFSPDHDHREPWRGTFAAIAGGLSGFIVGILCWALSRLF